MKAIWFGAGWDSGNPWLKLGPVSLVLFRWFDGWPRFEIYFRGRLVRSFPALN